MQHDTHDNFTFLKTTHTRQRQEPRSPQKLERRAKVKPWSRHNKRDAYIVQPG